jgi:hypothetical protein
MQATGHYFGSATSVVSCGKDANGNIISDTYPNCVQGKKKSIQAQIDAAIKSGDITP